MSLVEENIEKKHKIPQPEIRTSYIYILYRIDRVAKSKRPRVIDDQEMREDNQKLRPGCPPNYQICCERIEPKIFILTNLLSYLSLTNKNSSIRTNTTYV